jgi:hypothetical protein
MRASRLLALAVAAVALAPTGVAHGAVIGLADQNASAYGDARLRALKLGVARLVVPYDAATSQPQLVANWLAAVAAAGMQPHVAFEHLKLNGCPGAPCVVPSRATYAAAVRAFIARFAQVRIYTTWNEANHESQPVSGRPEVVAGYYEELKAACATCTVVAGDVLDSGGYVRWLERFQQATDSDPQLWGLHNYGDVTYATTEGTDAMLRTVAGQLWIEETGGIVVLRNAAGRVTLSFDEQRAAASIDRAFAIVAARPRITRMYVYHWQSGATGRFDAGLVRPDSSLRPSYAAMPARDRRAARGGRDGAAGPQQHAALERDVVEGPAGGPARARALHDDRSSLRRARRREAAHAPHVAQRHARRGSRDAQLPDAVDGAHPDPADARQHGAAQAPAGIVDAPPRADGAPDDAVRRREHADAEAREAALTRGPRAGQPRTCAAWHHVRQHGEADHPGHRR